MEVLKKQKKREAEALERMNVVENAGSGERKKSVEKFRTLFCKIYVGRFQRRSLFAWNENQMDDMNQIESVPSNRRSYFCCFSNGSGGFLIKY